MIAVETQGRVKVHVSEVLKDAWLVTEDWVRATPSRAEVGHRLALSIWPDDARRLAACWNACHGASTEELEGLAALGVAITKVVDGIKQERDHLRAELEAANDDRDVLAVALTAKRMQLEAARALLGDILKADDETPTGADALGLLPGMDDGLAERIRALLKGGA